MTTNGSPVPFEVWRMPFYYEDDPTKAKARPVVVAQVSSSSASVVALKVTGHGPRPEFPGEVRLMEWEKAGLPKPSTVRCSKQALIPLSAFKHATRYGLLSPLDVRAVCRGLEEVKTAEGQLSA